MTSCFFIPQQLNKYDKHLKMHNIRVIIMFVECVMCKVSKYHTQNLHTNGRTDGRTETAHNCLR